MSQAELAKGIVEFVAQGVEKVQRAQNELINGMEKYAKVSAKGTTLTFAAKGVGAVISGISKMVGKLGQFAAKGVKATAGPVTAVLSEAAKAVANFASNTVTEIGKAAKAFSTVGIIAGVGVSAFVTKAMAGTVEGERFGLALQFLTRVLGDGFAPYVRNATLQITLLARQIAQIDPATRQWASGIALAVASFAALAGVLVKISPMLGIFSGITKLIGPILSLGGVLLTVLGPVGLVVAAIGALAAAAAFIIAPMLDWESIMGTVGDALSGFLPIVQAVGAAILSFFGSASADGITFGSVVATIAEVFMDLWTVISGVSQALWGELVEGFKFLGQVAVAAYDMIKPALSAIGQAFSWLYSTFIAPVINKIIQAWELMTRGLSFSWKGVMQFAGEVVMGLVVVVARVFNGIYSIITGTISAVISALAWLGEKTKIISASTAEEMRKYGKSLSGKDLIDTDALVNRMGAASNKIGKALEGNGVTAKAMAKAIDESVSGIKAPPVLSKAANLVGKFANRQATGGNAQADLKKQLAEAAPGFRIKMDVGFEGFGSTFDRLQKAFASDPGLSVEQAQLEALNKNNELQQTIVANTGRIAMVGK